MDCDAPRRNDARPSAGTASRPRHRWSALLRRHDGWTVAAVLVLLTIAAYPRVFLTGEVISPAAILYWYPPWTRMQPLDGYLPKNNVLSDQIDSTIPEVEYFRDQLLKGNVPLWRDKTQNGAPMYGVIVNQLMVAPYSLIVLLFGTAQGLSIFALLRHLAGGWFFYRYGRIMGISRWASLAAAIAFSYGSFPIQTFGRALSFQLTLLPVTIYGMERIIRDTSYRWIALLPVLLHWNIVSGFPAGTVYSTYFFVLYGLFRIAWQGGGRLRLLALFTGLGVVAVLLSAPALVATADYFKSFDWTYRAERWRSRLPWLSLTTSLFPFLAGSPARTGDVPGVYYWWFEHGVYIGALPILALVVSIIYFRPSAGRIFFLGFGLWLFVLLFDVGGILERFIQFIPIFNSNPNTRQKLLLFFVLCVLAAYAFDDLTRLRVERRMFGWATVVVVPLLGGAAYSVFKLYSESPLTGFVRAHLWIQIPVLLTALGLLLAARLKSRCSSALRAAVIAFVFVDLQLMDKSALGLHNSADAGVPRRIAECFDPYRLTGWNPTLKRHAYFPHAPGIGYLKGHIGDGKMLSLDRAFLANTPLYFGLNNISGRGFFTRREKEMYRLMAEDAFRGSATQFLFSSNLSTRLDRAFVDALGVKFAVFAPGRSIEDMFHDELLRQKEWNHEKVISGGTRVRQTFTAPRDVRVNTIAFRAAGFALEDTADLTLSIYRELDRAHAGCGRVEWSPETGEIVASIEEYLFQSGGRYTVELFLAEKATGTFNIRCTKDVRLIKDGELLIDGQRWPGDLCMTIYRDAGRSSDGGSRAMSLDKFELVYRDDLVIYENKKAFPRAWLVGGLRFASDDETLEGLRADGLDLRNGAWAPMEDKAEIGSAGRIGEVRGQVITKTLRSSYQRFDVNGARDCFLIVSDNYHRNWTARLDGRPVDIFRADYNFRGVRIPAGNHMVEFSYQPPYLYATLTVAALTAAGLVAIVIGAARVRRRARRAAMKARPVPIG